MIKQVVFIKPAIVFFYLTALFLLTGGVAQQPFQPIAPLLEYIIVNSYPHDSGAFTQGLVYHNGKLYEGTGQYGASDLRQVDLQTGTVEKQRKLDSQYFGEGIAIHQGIIYQLTWQESVGFAYRLEDFSLLQDLYYTGEGWGITSDDTDLLMSDGSNQLYRYEPSGFSEINRVEVSDGGKPVYGLNELEFADGVVYANIYPTSQIARIDPYSGLVTGWLDLTGLLSEKEQEKANVLNGIAYNPDSQTLFVTGKYWPHLFEIKVSD